MWALAGLSSIYTGSGAKIPTSAYSLSLSLASNVGFHDAGPQAIGEDMHMFIKCLFSTGGNLISETIYSPASQLDVVAGERGGLQGFWNDHVARYKQAIRHMWGSLDTGYGYTRLINSDYQYHPETELSITHRQPIPTVFTQSQEPAIPSLPAVIKLRTIREEKTRSKRPAGSSKNGRRNFAEEDFVTPSPSDSSNSSSSASVISADDEEEDTEETSVSSLSETEDSYQEKIRLIQQQNQLQQQHQQQQNEKDGIINNNRPGQPEMLSRRIMPFVSLVLRLYEAHLLMGHMLLLVALRIFSASTNEIVAAPAIIPPLPTLSTISDGTEFLAYAYDLTDRMRGASLLFTILMFAMYDRYHQTCVGYRWKLPGGRLGVQSADRSLRPFPVACFDWFALPAGVVYGIVPLLQAQFMQLFTDRIVYTVSFKPKGKEMGPRRERDLEKAEMKEIMA